MTETKAANYGATAGSVIVGNLARGGDGKFTSAGNSDGPTPDRSQLRQAIGLDAKPKAGKKSGKGAKPKQTDEEKAAEKQAKQDANRKQVAAGLGVSDDDAASLSALAAGGEPGNTDDLVKRGLVEVGGDGAPRLTTSGQALNTAMNRGDLGAAKRVASVAQDRKTKADQQAAEKQKRDEEKAKKQAEKDRKAGKTPAPAPVEGQTMTNLANAVQTAITEFLARLTAAKAISADRAASIEETADLLAAHLTGMDEELVADALKAGRRNSSRDQSTIQNIHDFAANLGADCGTGSKPTLKALPVGVSYDQARDAIAKVIREREGAGEDKWFWVVDLFENRAIYESKEIGELYEVIYSFTPNGLLVGEPVKVQRVTDYVPVMDGAPFKSMDDEGRVYLKGHVHEAITGGSAPTDNPYAVKSLGDDRVGGYAVLFGDAGNTDLTGDYFTKSTDFWLNEIGPNRPMLYHHAIESATKGDPVVGVWDTLRVDDIGVWAEGELKKAHRYKKAVKQLVDAGALGLSSGSAPNLVLKTRKQRANEITRWPILEVSLTPEPAEPRMTPVTAIKSYFADAGLDLPAALDDAPTTPDTTEGAEVQMDAQSVDDRARRLTVELDLLTL